MKSLKVKSDLAELDIIRSFLKESLREISLSEEDYFRIEVSLIEVCTNIMRYAYAKANKGNIVLKVWQEKKKVILEIRDNGIPFDPTEVGAPNIQDVIKSGETGGFGILLYRKFMDSCDYKRKNKQNVLTLQKKI